MSCEEAKVEAKFHKNYRPIDLETLLTYLNTPITEEQIWCLIYQIIKIYKNYLGSTTVQEFQNDLIVSGLKDILIHKDGRIECACLTEFAKNARTKKPFMESSNRSCFGRVDQGEKQAKFYKKLMSGILLVIYTALDFGVPSDMERWLDAELYEVILQMSGFSVQDEACFDSILRKCMWRLGSKSPKAYYQSCAAKLAEQFELINHILGMPDLDDHEIIRSAFASENSVCSLSKNDAPASWQHYKSVMEQLQKHPVFEKRKTLSEKPTRFQRNFTTNLTG